MELSQEQLEYLRSTFITVATPAYGGMVTERYASSLMRLATTIQYLGCKMEWSSLSNESLISRGRNTLVSKFLYNKDATHLIFIDSDIGFEPEQVIRAILHNKDIVGGLYPKKALPISFVANVSPDAVDEKGKVKIDQHGLIPASRVGTGFMMIKRHVFEQMMVAYPDKQFNNNIGMPPEYNQYMYDFFSVYVSQDNNRELLSEDWAFCDMARVIGVEIFIDSNTRLAHSGSFIFPGDPSELYKSMGLDPQQNPQLIPTIASRSDGLKDDSILLQHKPDFEALKAWKENKNKTEVQLPLRFETK